MAATDVTIKGLDPILDTEVFVNQNNRITVRQEDETFGEQMVILDVIRARAVIAALESAIADLIRQGHG